MKDATPVPAWMVALLVMAGCAPAGGSAVAPAPAAQSAATTVFRCGEAVVRAGFEGQTLELRIDGRTYRLEQVEAASGARYVSVGGAESVVFWNKGEEAALTVGARTYPRCRQAEGEAAPGVESYAARGNEPSWSLAVAADGLVLTTDYGSTVLRAPVPRRETTAEGYRYVAETPAGLLRAEIRPCLCRDTMSGMRYPDTVTVRVNEKTLHGCGGDAAALLHGEWSVQDIVGVPVAAGSQVTLNFLPEGRLAGTASCNRYTASYALSGEGLTIGKAASTRMACPPPLMEQERKFLDVLQTVVRHEITDAGLLVLIGADERKITARRN